MNEGNKEIASLIYWAEGVDKKRIDRWIKKLKEQGFVKSDTTHEYNPNHGSPVWYIP